MKSSINSIELIIFDINIQFYLYKFIIFWICHVLLLKVILKKQFDNEASCDYVGPKRTPPQGSGPDDCLPKIKVFVKS